LWDCKLQEKNGNEKYYIFAWIPNKNIFPIFGVCRNSVPQSKIWRLWTFSPTFFTSIIFFVKITQKMLKFNFTDNFVCQKFKMQKKWVRHFSLAKLVSISKEKKDGCKWSWWIWPPCILFIQRKKMCGEMAYVTSFRTAFLNLYYYVARFFYHDLQLLNNYRKANSFYWLINPFSPRLLLNTDFCVTFLIFLAINFFGWTLT